jgi:HlyD family secretion protein
MTATVTITTARRDDALRVPLRALRFRPESGDGAAPAPAGVAAGRSADDASAVYALDAGSKLRRVDLRTGLRDERYAEVVEGDLAAGAAVAVAYRRPLEAKQPARSPFAPAPRR